MSLSSSEKSAKPLDMNSVTEFSTKSMTAPSKMTAAIVFFIKFLYRSQMNNGLNAKRGDTMFERADTMQATVSRRPSTTAVQISEIDKVLESMIDRRVKAQKTLRPQESTLIEKEAQLVKAY